MPESAVVQPRMLDVAPATFDTLDMALGNELLVAWGHRLGPLNRPFSQRGYVLLVDGEPVSLAMSASAVSGTVAGYTRNEVVELARLCSRPGHAWASRVMVRMWREVFARRWPDWPVRAAISYSLNAEHRGDLYRFDGWAKVRDDAGHPPGATATWAKYGVDHPARGPKTLWVWRYDGA